jgi:hypothetical protein
LTRDERRETGESLVGAWGLVGDCVGRGGGLCGARWGARGA